VPLRKIAADIVDHSMSRPRPRPHDGKIEINVLAAKPGSAAQKRHIDAGVATAFRNQPQAVKAGDLLIMSAQMANDQNGLVAGASDDPRQPCFGSSAEAQAEIIIDKFEKLCEAAGRRFQTS